MNVSALMQDQQIACIASPADSQGEFVFFEVSKHGVIEIQVTQLAGPMGFYDCAVVRWDDGRPDQIHPLHMMDTIRLLATD